MFHLNVNPSPPSSTGRDAPRRRFLGDHDAAARVNPNRLVQPLDEVNGVQILPPAILVWNPRTLVAAVVQVQHRRDRVDAETVHVQLIQPIQRIRDQEVANFVTSEVENQRAPVRMLSDARIPMLIQRGAVEQPQREIILGKVRRHPVDDHPDAVLVTIVHEVAKVVRVPVARRRSIVAGDLVAPRTAKRMLRQRHRLDVREAKTLHVLDQPRGQLPVRQRMTLLRPGPRTQVQFVNRDRLAGVVAPRTPGHPLPIPPRVRRCVDPRRRPGRLLHRKRVRVRLRAELTRARLDLILVEFTRQQPRNENLKYARAAHLSHRVTTPAPIAERADHAHANGVRGPDRKGGTLNTIDRPYMSTHALPKPPVISLVEQMQVNITQRRQKAVRVLLLPRVAVRKPVSQTVAHWKLCARNERREDPAGNLQLHRLRTATRAQEVNSGRLGMKDTHEHATTPAALMGVRAQKPVRFAVFAGNQAFQLALFATFAHRLFLGWDHAGIRFVRPPRS
jgi:hypothetical protein